MNKLEDCMVERPRLFATGMPNDLAIILKAMEVAKVNGMDVPTIRNEVMQTTPEKRKEVLSKYFEVI